MLIFKQILPLVFITDSRQQQKKKKKEFPADLASPDTMDLLVIP